MLENEIYTFLKDIKWLDEDINKNLIYLPAFNKLFEKFINTFSDKIEKLAFEKVLIKNSFDFTYDEYSYYYLTESKFNLIYKNCNKELAKHKALDILALFENFIQEFAAIPTISGKRINNNQNSFGVFAQCDNKHINVANVECSNSIVTATFDFSFINLMLKTHKDENGLVLTPRLSPYQVGFLMDNNLSLKDKKTVATWLIQLMKININAFIDDSVLLMKEKIEKRQKEGIPLLIEVYQKSIEKNKYTLLLRFNNEKRKISIDDFSLLPYMLEDIQKQMYQSKMKKNINSLNSLIPCCMNDNCISKLMEDNFELIIPFMQAKRLEKCQICNQENKKNLYKIKKY